MAGHLNGESVRLQREEPRAHYVHCLAHSLNLYLQECSCKCSAVRDALGVTQELYNLIRPSPKRLGLFNRIKNKIAPSSPGLKPLCPTRWTERTSAVDSVVKNYLVINTKYEEIADECHGEPSRKASGLRAVSEVSDLLWSQTCICYLYCHRATINNSPGTQYKHTRGYICC
uniref:DUF4371 domain-containing protein n=1 Tax=Amphimedon queenslandica TaxID=400682 RepID=A0A1X7VL78_AMPQE